MTGAILSNRYFGGNAAHRGDANIEMLAKMRIVMLEKWEGHCWADCFANASSPACQPGCAVEDLIIDTHRRVKALNPNSCSVLYLNTLLDFPFYRSVPRSSLVWWYEIVLVGRAL